MEKQLSKKQQAAQLFVNMNGSDRSVPRKTLIEAFMNEIGMSAAGAKTYVGNFRSGIWKVEKQQEIDYQAALNEMSNAKLVELYNQKSAHHITKFRDKKTAVSKVLQIFGAEIGKIFA